MRVPNAFRRGFNAGLPIGLGYFSVSLSFGILAISYGFTWWQAVLISMLTVTSAGQFAGIGIMCSPGQYIAMLVSQLTINVRYSMMAVSLSQKANSSISKIWRWILGFFITDEIFAVAAAERELSRPFFLGLTVLPYTGWALGTLCGALVGNILPQRLMNALCIALYGMFVAIVVPVAKKERSVLAVVLIAMAVSCLFTWLPGLKEISSGISVSLCAILAAAAGAAMFPVKEDV
ncbi:MAG: AzlC family ABC transporter permease [Oscillospiraceae bacterium]|nr:AzlC family ABC transporter permease [Oscillospiraceae bacterium]